MLDYKDLGTRIRERRKALNMSQEDLALAVGYKGKSIISRIEKGEINLPHSRILDIAKALRCSTAFLINVKTTLPHEVPRQIRIAKELNIPLHKLDVNPALMEKYYDWKIKNLSVSNNDIVDFATYMNDYNPDNSFTEEEIELISRVHNKLEEAIDKKREKEFEGKQIIYASAGSAKSQKIESIISTMSELDETAPTNALDLDKLLELGNIIKKMDNDQLTKLIKHANLIEKGEL